MHGSGLRVESYGRCRHNTPEGADHWMTPGNRLRDVPDSDHWGKEGGGPWYVPSNVHPALTACRGHRLILAEENELCEG